MSSTDRHPWGVLITTGGRELGKGFSTKPEAQYYALRLYAARDKNAPEWTAEVQNQLSSGNWVTVQTLTRGGGR